MAAQQEKFTYAELKVYEKVKRILGEDDAEPENNGSAESSKNDSDSDDPLEAHREKQRKLWEEREQKRASITEDQKKLADDLLSRMRW